MLYIHIPFCKGKCIYCNFYSAGNPDWEKYFKAIASELSERIDELRGVCLSSVYIGGGTPSLIPTSQFQKIFSLNGKKGKIWKIISDSEIEIGKDLEFTIEVNPEDVTEEKAICWKLSGVNRISMGIQSLNERELEFLRRRHNADKVSVAMSILNKYFNNISVDLIYGIPGQTEVSLKNSLEKAISLKPKHISTYALTYEPSTPLDFFKNAGKLNPCTDEDYINFDNLINNFLNSEGFERYEISNYAMPGYRSRHNCGYWSSRPYLGIGPAACSFDGNKIRRSNQANLKKYIERFYGLSKTNENTTNDNFFEEEILTLKERIEERVMLQLRTKDGIDIRKFTNDFGAEETNQLMKRAQIWIERGFLLKSEGRLIITTKGIMISDNIITSLWS